MRISLPLVWLVPFFIFGLLIGRQFPSVVYLWLAAVALLAQGFVWRRRHWPEVLAVAFWLLLGAARMTHAVQEVGTGRSTTDKALSAMRTHAHRAQAQLMLRMERAGLDGETLALTSALLLGRRSQLSYETRHAFFETGTGHLLALSGLHLGIVYGVLHLLFLSFVGHTRWRWHALPPLLLCIWGYTMLAGAPNSLVRAAIMCSMLAIGSLSERHVVSLHSLAVAALVVLMISPRALYDVGFQLSFVCVFFILALYLPIHEIFCLWIVRGGRLLSMLGVALVAQLGAMPLIAYHFHTFALLAPLLSPVLIPLTALIIYGGLLLLLLPWHVLAVALTCVVRAELWIVGQCVRVPGATLHDIYVPTWAVVLTYVLLLCATLRLHVKFRAGDFRNTPGGFE